MALIGEAVQAGCRKVRACAALGLSVRTLQRWERAPGRDRRKGSRALPANRLSDAERARALAVMNQPEHCDKSPNQIVPLLADDGQYIGSESTLYRILREEKMLRHRHRSAVPRHYEPVVYAANAPNAVWSWDITFLPTAVRGVFLYLYLIVDLYSRKVVAWQVHEREGAEYAAELLAEACRLEGVVRDQVVLHADNGAPMKGATMLAMLQVLGVMPSFSRPSVSDDNPFSEALFRTLKYCPAYPRRPFADIAEARAWVEAFVLWYNREHRHSAICFVTPEQRHRGEDRALLQRRHAVYQRARSCHPERWSGKTRNWTQTKTVHITNYRSRRTKTTEGEVKKAA